MPSTSPARKSPDRAPAPEAAALNAFFRIAEAWSLRVTEQRKLLGDPPESTFYKWKRERHGALGR
ncbi:MAG TPA: antitoxin Xre-like helix-turn-helix domain-containing protein, partial [Rhodanobacteraceae bacterium]|nr:antitoxin Xre-like helix-turn-helix domain-containing protein [Rhodanobacteraceae bacterium]